MHFKLIVLLSFVSFVRNHDVSIGSDGGRKIFEDTRYAGPAIWRQVENITVMASDNEMISKVNITDLRPDKDGDVEIVAGGNGEKSVTIELKSPTVLRGYEFHIEVYSTPTGTGGNDAETEIPDGTDKNIKTTETPESSASESSEVIPASVGKDSDISRPARETSDVQQTDSESTEAGNESSTDYTTTDAGDDSTTEESEEDDSTTEESEEDDSTTEESEGSGSEGSDPVGLDSDLLRPARHASEGETVEDASTTTEMEYFDVKSTLDYMPTTEETSSENHPPKNILEIIRPARETDEESESDSTTEIVTEESIDTAANNMDINKNNYTNMDILEYIKRKEQGARLIRRTDEEYSSDESEEDSSQSSANDETVDLVPPEENTSYSDNFYTDSTETTMESTETTPGNNPRYVRRLASDLMFDATTETTENTDDVTEGPTMADVVTTEAIENTRNSRHTEYLMDNGDLDLNNETSAEDNMISDDKISSGIVLLKGSDIIVSADGKELRFNLPIVLIIGNENNFPLFNMIGSRDMDKRVLNEDPENVMNLNLDENVPEYTSVDAEAASDIIMNDDSY